MKHVVEALRNFLARYARVIRAAWAARASMEGPSRTSDELAFLPAHLEIVESPASPAARWTMRTIMAVFAVALAWACIGQVDIVAVAPGKAVVDSRTKILQPSETAVVQRILVRDGEAVRRGQVLVELDATMAAADLAKAGDALLDARVAEIRYGAMARALASGRTPVLRDAVGVPAERMQSERALVASEFEAFVAKRDGLAASLAQREAELNTVLTSIGPLEETARIAQARAADYARLLEGQYVGRHEYLQREQERIAAQRDLVAQRSRAVELRAATATAREDLRLLVADTTQRTLDGLRQARDQTRQLTPDVEKTRQRDRLTKLRAPVDGTVQQLAIHTVGGVVTPAQALLAVVPSDEALEVEATVLNKDIGFVRAGQPVTVKIDSFPFTRYGYLTGTVASISHDAAQDEKLGLIFPARVHLDRADLIIDGVPVHINSGMSLSVEIKTGKRRVIDYLLSPLRRQAGEAMRER